MTIVPTVVMPLSSAARSGTTAAFTISGEPPAPRRSSCRRDSVAPCGASRRAARSASTNGASNRSSRRRPVASPFETCRQRLHRGIPADDAIVQIEHEQSVVERFENVLVERAHPIELERLDVQLPIEACVLERGGDLSGHCAEQTHVLAVQRLAGVLAADGQYRDRRLPSRGTGRSNTGPRRARIRSPRQETGSTRSDRRAPRCGRPPGARRCRTLSAARADGYRRNPTRAPTP